MPASVDSLLVALLVVLTPEADPGHGGGRLLAGVQTEQQVEQPEKPKTTKPPEDPEACRYFMDPEARRKCAIRAGRAASGSAEPQQSFPEGLFWLVPSEPPMPPRMPADTQR
jgi:hypothetical protein